MKLTTSTIPLLTIDDVPGLDPIRVMWENYNPGQGRIVITCYGRAWTAAWFGMAGASVEVFFCTVSPDYIIGNMTSHMAPALKKNQKHDEAYLTRIIIAAQEALRRYTRNRLHGTPL